MPRLAAAEAPKTSAQRFGAVFRAYRVKLGLSQRRMAALLEVAESTVARIEAGTRKPPRQHSFYERLRAVPGLSEADVAALLSTGAAPRWFDNDVDDLAPGKNGTGAGVGGENKGLVS